MSLRVKFCVHEERGEEEYIMRKVQQHVNSWIMNSLHVDKKMRKHQAAFFAPEKVK